MQIKVENRKFSTVWHFIRASDQHKLERVQERALRAVYQDKNSDYEELLTKAYVTWPEAKNTFSTNSSKICCSFAKIIIFEKSKKAAMLWKWLLPWQKFLIKTWFCYGK